MTALSTFRQAGQALGRHGRQVATAALIAGTAMAAAVAPQPAQAADFTQDECKIIYHVARDVVKPRVSVLSQEFRQSLANFFSA